MNTLELGFKLPVSLMYGMKGRGSNVAYLIGVNSGTLEPLPFIPYISDTGNLKPSSSVFTLFLVLSSFVTSIVVVVRFFQISSELRCRKTNIAALVVAFIFLFGKIAVSSFQLSSHKGVHFGAAGLYFGGATIYCAMHCYITRREVVASQTENTNSRGDQSNKPTNCFLFSNLSNGGVGNLSGIICRFRRCTLTVGS